MITILGEVATAVVPVHLIARVTREIVGLKSWASTKVTFEPTEANIARMGEILPKSKVEDRRPGRGPAPRPPFATAVPPFRQQLEGLAACGGADHFGYIMEQGTGKTKLLLDDAVKLWTENKIDAVLVITKKGVHRQWTHKAIPSHIHPSIPTARYAWPCELTDGMLRKRSLVFLSINFTAIIYQKGQELLRAFCKAHRKRLMIIIDESQGIMNPTSQVTKAAHKFRDYASHRRISTGTPIAKNLENYWSQISWLDPDILGITSRSKFRAEYCVMGGFENRTITDHRNVEAFMAKVAPHVFIAKKEGLPEKIRSTYTFQLSAAERKVYAEMKKRLVTELDDGSISSALNVAASLAKLQGISSGFIRDDDKALKTIGTSRFDALMELLESVDSHPAGAENAMIWCRFIPEIEMLLRLLPGSVGYYGATSPRERERNVEAFMRGEAKYFISNAASGGTGLDMPGATKSVIYYSNTFNAIDRWQSEDRPHRHGMVHPITYFDLIAEKTLDTKLALNLRKKKELSDKATEARSELRYMMDNENEEVDLIQLEQTAFADEFALFAK